MLVEKQTNQSLSREYLAKLLATENIQIRYGNYPTAAFDLKSRVLHMPIWKNVSRALQDMLIVHEVGHALNTPKAGWEQAANQINQKHNGGKKESLAAVQSFINVVEDARIDKLQRRRYPGSKKNYAVGYEELFTRGFYGDTKDFDTYNLVDRLNLYFKGGYTKNIKFLPEEQKFIKQLENIETWDEVVAAADELYAFCKSRNQIQDTAMLKKIRVSIMMPGNGDDSDEPEAGEEADIEIEIEGDQSGKEGNSEKNSDKSGEGDQSDEGDQDGDSGNGSSDDKSDGDDEKDSDGEGSGKSGEGKSGEDEKKDKSEKGKSGEEKDKSDKGKSEKLKIKIQKQNQNDKPTQGNSGGQQGGYGNSGQTNIPESKTDQAWNQALKQLVDSKAKTPKYLVLPMQSELKHIVDPFKKVMKQHADHNANDPKLTERMTAEFLEFKAKENVNISYMVKEFEVRKAADIYARINEAKTGVLNTSKLYAYKYSDDIFRRQSVVPTGKNHGFVIIIDWSSSMSGNISATVQQLLTIALFCRKVQIPFEVYTFRDIISSYYSKHAENHENADTAYPKADVGAYDGRMVFNHFKLRQIMSSRMNGAEMNQAFINMFRMARSQYPCDTMGGTPLNDAIFAAVDVVTAFKKTYNTQITNVCFLTDGESNPTAFELKVSGQLGERNIVVDPNTKLEYDVQNGSYYGFGGKEMTVALLKRLKDRTGCNLVGFYLTNSYKNILPAYTTVSEKINKDAAASWKDNGYVSINGSAGYDRYFIVDVARMRIDNREFSVSGNATETQVGKKFSEYLSKKANNRMLLRAFIEEISK